MWETIGYGVLVGLAVYGAFTLLERFYRAVTTQKQTGSLRRRKFVRTILAIYSVD